MTKLQKCKKGFTLTELAIVIAVIAILIAVLVPTFVSLINKAQESSDSQLVKNLNTALSTEEAIDGKAETMAEALAVASENGYNVDKLTPASTGDIVWDQESNRFLLIDEKGSIVYSDSTTSSDVLNNKYQLWYIVESETDLNKTDYSQYLAYEVSGTVTSENGASIDVGDNTNVTLSVSGTAATSTSSSASATTPALASKKLTAESTSSGLEFRVNSNGSKVILEVTGEVTIYGTVSGNVELKSGKLTIAESAYVPAVYVTAESADAVSVTNNASTTVEVAVSSSITVTVSGSYSETTVDSSSISNFAGGFGTENSPYMIANYAQFVNMKDFSYNMNNKKAYYFKLANDIVIDADSYSDDNWYFCGTFDGDGHSITAGEGLKEKTKSASGVAYLFRRFAGECTVKNLVLYSTEDCALTVVNNIIQHDAQYTDGVYHCTNDAGSPNMTKTTFYGIDFYSVDNKTVNVTQGNFGFISPNYFSGGEIVVEQCNVYASVQNSSTCTAALFNCICYGTTVTVKDCVITGDITGADQVGVITCNSSYNATYTASTVKDASVVTSTDVSGITIDNVKFTGTAEGTYVNAFSAKELGDSWVLNALYQYSIGGTYKSSSASLKDYNFNVYYSSSGLSITAEGTYASTYTYKVALSLSTLIYSNGGENNSTKIMIDVSTVSDTSGLTQFVTKGIKAYEYSEAVSAGVISNGAVLANLSGAINIGKLGDLNVYLYSTSSGMYLITDESDYYTINTTVNNVSVYAYSGDSLIGTKSYSYSG